MSSAGCVMEEVARVSGLREYIGDHWGEPPEGNLGGSRGGSLAGSSRSLLGILPVILQWILRGDPQGDPPEGSSWVIIQGPWESTWVFLRWERQTNPCPDMAVRHQLTLYTLP